jgi:hypothetical protein
MNASDPTNAQFAAYRAMWAYYNAVLFGGALGDVILNFSRLARSLGFFAPERWRDASDVVTHEISLYPAHLTRDNAKDAASTLVHEMCHLFRHGQPNPPRNGYHDRQWADKMEALGLMPSATAAPGGARVGYRMSHYILPGGAFERAFEQMPAECHLPWTCGIDDEARGRGGGEKKAMAQELEKAVSELEPQLTAELTRTIGNVPTPIQLRLAELGEENASIVVVNANSSKPVRFEVPINWAIE